jgi:hypothetical protein
MKRGSLHCISTGDEYSRHGGRIATFNCSYIGKAADIERKCYPPEGVRLQGDVDWLWVRITTHG